MSYQETKFSEIAKAIRMMQGGTTDTFAATDFANQIRNIDRDSLPYKSTIALEDNAVTVNDTLDDELDGMAAYGASEQTVTEQGKNLFDIHGEINDYYTGTILTDETANTIVDGNLRVVRNKETSVPVGQKIYVGAGNNITISAKIAGYEASESDSGIFATLGVFPALPSALTSFSSFTEEQILYHMENQTRLYLPDSAESDEIIVFFGRGNGTNYVDFTDIQVEIVDNINDSYTDYEPYIPNSPSPDHPAEIRSVGGEVAVSSANIANVASFVGGQFVNNNDGTYTLTRETATLRTSARNYSIQIQRGKRYRIQAKLIDKTTTENKLYCQITYAGGTNAYHALYGSDVMSAVFTASTSADVSYMQFYIHSDDAIGSYITVSELQVYEIATVDDAIRPYQPYFQAETMTLPTLYGVGDVKDILYVDRAQERAWVERNCGVLYLTGEENVSVYADARFAIYGIIYSKSGSAGGGYCSHFKTYRGGSSNNVPEGTILWQADNGNTFIGALQEFGTVAAFKAWLAELYADETPMTVVYQLAASTIEELDYTALPTFPGGTVISIAPVDDSPNSVVAEVTLRTVTEHENEDIVSMVLTSVGVTPSGDTETDLATLEELGINPYSVTTYDPVDTYASQVATLGIQPTNHASDNMNILNNLGVNVYE